MGAASSRRRHPLVGRLRAAGDVVLGRRAAWDAAGGRFDETFQFAMDWDLLLRLRESGARFARVPRFLGAFRVHASQKTSDRLETVGAMEMARLRERVHGQVVLPQAINQAIRGVSPTARGLRRALSRRPLAILTTDRRACGTTASDRRADMKSCRH